MHGNAKGKHADDNRRRSIEQIRCVTHDEGHFAAAELREVDGAQESDGNTEKRGQKKQLGAADNSVGHAATRFAHWSRQFREEVPIDRGAAVVDEIAQDEEENRDGDEGAEASHGEHEITHEFTPAKTGVHAFPIPLPR